MAKKSVRSRIERVLSLEQPSRGVLRSTTWALVLTAAMPVIYLASTVQNASSGPRTPVYSELLATLWGAAHPSSQVPAAKQAVEAKPILNLLTSQDPLRQIEPEIQKLRQSPAGVDDPQSQLNTSPVNPAPVLPIQVEDGQVTLQKMMDDLKSQEQTLLRSYTAQHPMVRSLREQIEALKRQLEDLQNGTALTNKEILLDLPDNEGDLLAYLRALAEARPVIPNPERPLLSEYSDLINRTRVSSTVPFTFTLRGSAEGTYSIKASAFSGSQECGKSASCKFLIFSNGIVASEYVRFEGHPGIEVNQVLRSSTLEFTLTCRSQQCTISSIEDGRSINQTLKINETAVFTEAAQITATVN